MAREHLAEPETETDKPAEPTPPAKDPPDKQPDKSHDKQHEHAPSSR
jgi:hypothetical protein